MYPHRRHVHGLAEQWSDANVQAFTVFHHFKDSHYGRFDYHAHQPIRRLPIRYNLRIPMSVERGRKRTLE